MSTEQKEAKKIESGNAEGVIKDVYKSNFDTPDKKPKMKVVLENGQIIVFWQSLATNFAPNIEKGKVLTIKDADKDNNRFDGECLIVRSRSIITVTERQKATKEQLQECLTFLQNQPFNIPISYQTIKDHYQEQYTTTFLDDLLFELSMEQQVYEQSFHQYRVVTPTPTENQVLPQVTLPTMTQYNIMTDVPADDWEDTDPPIKQTKTEEKTKEETSMPPETKKEPEILTEQGNKKPAVPISYNKNSMAIETRQKNAIQHFDSNGEEYAITKENLKKYIAKQATDEELVIFLAVCKLYKLNPFKSEIHFLKFGNEPATHKVAYTEFLKRAEKFDVYSGFQAGLILQNEDGSIIESESTFYTAKQTIVGAWCKVYRKDRQFAIIRKPNFDAHVKKTKDNYPNHFWKNMPAEMIYKVAIESAFRDAFPDEFAGLYGEGEMTEE